MSTARVTFADLKAALAAKTVVIVGRRERLEHAALRDLLPPAARDVWAALLDGLSPGDAGAAGATWVPGTEPCKVVAALLPEPCSRHNSPARPHAVTALVRKAAKGDSVGVVLVLDDDDHATASGAAVARAFPLYSRKKKDDGAGNGDAVGEGDRSVSVGFLGPDGEVAPPEALAPIAEGIRLAARLVDMPTSELHTDAFVEEARQVASATGAGLQIVAGEELKRQGFGGLWGVGKAAEHLPAMVVLTHDPEGADKTICWVGKGIVYDTGGLSIKSKTTMPGMKGDMGGAAAVIGAFQAAVASGFPHRLHAILCLAENAVGSKSTRPDDILDMYSGKTVEVNNTDAEGRLVLADGVAWASRHLEPDVIVDLATLTGAQLVATGKRHAGIVCNSDELERRAVEAGRSCGDLVHPLPYCPEFFRKEFKSKVADLKNSVKDRMNAQSSCAAQFVAEHLSEDWTGEWLHVDLAGPADDQERGTGYGVALLVTLFSPA